jgi:hypothetical protein
VFGTHYTVCQLWINYLWLLHNWIRFRMNYILLFRYYRIKQWYGQQAAVMTAMVMARTVLVLHGGNSRGTICFQVLGRAQQQWWWKCGVISVVVAWWCHGGAGDSDGGTLLEGMEAKWWLWNLDIHIKHTNVPFTLSFLFLILCHLWGHFLTSQFYWMEVR